MKNDYTLAIAFHKNVILDTLRDGQEEGEYIIKSRPAELFHDRELIHCEIEFKDFYSTFQLQEMPGCCAVMTLSYIKAIPFAQENVDRVIKVVEDAVYNAGYGSLVMTQIVPMASAMFWKKEPWYLALKREWKPSRPFINAKSGNFVIYLTKDLGQKGLFKGAEEALREAYKKGKEK